MMPELSGYELAARLRSRGFRAPLLALSASSEVDVDGKCRTAGFARLLSKPVRRADLVGAVCEQIRSGQGRL